MIILKEPQTVVLGALQSVAGIVERRHTLPILSNVLIDKNENHIQLTTSDLEVQIKRMASWQGDSSQFKTTVGARKLIDILRSLPSDQVVTLSAQQNKLILSAGKSKFTLQTLAAEDFPLVQESQQFGAVFTIPQKQLKNLLSQVSFAMAVHDIRYYLNGMLFVIDGDKLSLVATDGHRLAYSQLTLEGVNIPKQEVILPRKTVLEIQRLLTEGDDNIEIQFSANQAKFNLNGLEFITKLVEGKFPDYNRVIPKDSKMSITLGRLPLMAALQRSAILMNEKFKGVRMNIESGTLRITSINNEQEESVDELDIDYSGDSVEIGFNVTYLIDALSNITNEMVTMSFSNANSSVLFSVPGDSDFKYVIMPMRI